MKEYLAENLVKIQQTLTLCSIQLGRSKTAPNRPKVRSEAISKTEWVRDQALILGLRSTAQGAVRLCGIIQRDNSDEIDRGISDVLQRFHDDIVSLIFFYLPPDKLAYHNKTDLFGEQFKSNFPTANAEIIEAGNCLAFDRFTACAYHLTRALEISLRVLFVSLGMERRIWSVTRWKSLCERIEQKIKKNDQHRTNDPIWRKDRGFFEKAHAFLAAARAPLRNSTVHVDVTYPDEGSVRPLWLATEAFMRHIATNLKE